MIWFFTHDEDELRVETRYDNESSTYVLVVNWPDGPGTEHFATESDFRARVAEVQETLNKSGWRRLGPPRILQDGWRIA